MMTDDELTATTYRHLALAEKLINSDDMFKPVKGLDRLGATLQVARMMAWTDGLDRLTAQLKRNG